MGFSTMCVCWGGGNCFVLKRWSIDVRTTFFSQAMKFFGDYMGLHFSVLNVRNVNAMCHYIFSFTL